MPLEWEAKRQAPRQHQPPLEAAGELGDLRSAPGVHGDERQKLVRAFGRDRFWNIEIAGEDEQILVD